MPRLMTLEGFLGCRNMGDDIDGGMSCRDGVCVQTITPHPVNVPIGVIENADTTRIPGSGPGAPDILVESAPKKNLLPLIAAAVAVYLAVK